MKGEDRKKSTLLEVIYLVIRGKCFSLSEMCSSNCLFKIDPVSSSDLRAPGEYIHQWRLKPSLSYLSNASLHTKDAIHGSEASLPEVFILGMPSFEVLGQW